MRAYSYFYNFTKIIYHDKVNKEKPIMYNILYIHDISLSRMWNDETDESRTQLLYALKINLACNSVHGCYDF